MFDALLTSALSLAIGVGLFVTALLDLFFCAGVSCLFGKALLVNKIYLLHWVVGAP